MCDTYKQDYLAQAERYTTSGFGQFDELIDEARGERRLTHVQGRLLQGQDRHLLDRVIPHESIGDFRCRGTGRSRYRRTDIYRRVMDDLKVTS